jgi:hypothetical protein
MPLWFVEYYNNTITEGNGYGITASCFILDGMNVAVVVLLFY